MVCYGAGIAAGKKLLSLVSQEGDRVALLASTSRDARDAGHPVV